MADKTISFNYDIVETGTITRTAIFTDMVGIMTPGYSYQQTQISTNSITLGSISSLLFVRSDNPLNISINGTTTEINQNTTGNNIFLATLSASNATISNSNTNTIVNAIIMYF